MLVFLLQLNPSQSDPTDNINQISSDYQELNQAAYKEIPTERHPKVGVFTCETSLSPVIETANAYIWAFLLISF